MNTYKEKKLKIANKLVEGLEVATQLKQLLSQPGSGLGPAEDLAAKIFGYFNMTISDLDAFEPFTSSLASVEGSQNASCDHDGKFEDSGDSRKRLGPVKTKRGCYKRKKRSETWTITSSTISEDAFTWRKYGQKDILNAKFPRNYFRCTHKYTQGCKATKQVQKVELEPTMFSITYIGNHTCDINAKTTKIKACDHNNEIIVDSEEHKSPSLKNSMKKEEENHHHHYHHGSSMENDLSLVWQEIVFEDDHHHHHGIDICGETSTSINVLGSPDLMVFGASGDFMSSENEQFSIFNSYSNLS